MNEEATVRDRLARAGLQRLRFDERVYQDAQDLYNERPKPSWAQMARALARLHPNASPQQSTLRDWEKKKILSKERTDEPWVFGSGDADDDALILPVARVSLMQELGEDVGDESPQVMPLSKRRARWIVHIRRAATELDPNDEAHMHLVMQLARLAITGEEGVSNVAMVLALAPWRDEGGDLLQRAGTVGLIPSAVVWLVLDTLGIRLSADALVREHIEDDGQPEEGEEVDSER